MPSGQLEDRCLRLKTIEINDSNILRASKFKLVFKHESGLVQELDASEKSIAAKWECNIYVDLSTVAILEVHRTGRLQKSGSFVEFKLDFNTDEFRDGGRVRRKENGLSVELIFGAYETSSEVARIRIAEAIKALESKKEMIDMLDMYVHRFDFVVQAGTALADLHTATKVAAAVVSFLFEKVQDISKSHQEFADVIHDMDSILPTIEQALERLQETQIQHQLRQFVNLVRKTSQDLIDCYSKSKTKVIRNSPKKDAAVKLKYDVQRLKDNISLAVIVVSAAHLTEIKAILTTLRCRSLPDDEKEALNLLEPPEDISYDKKHCCHSGTRTSVIQDMKTWAVSKDMPSRLYWLYGVAGSGKSSVATSIANSLDDLDVLSGAFFCKRDVLERKRSERFVRTQASLLAKACEPFRQLLLSKLKKDPNILKKPLSMQFYDLIEYPLQRVSQDDVPAPIILVVDALDECDDSEFIASCLARMVELAAWLRVVVTSRPTPDIRKGFSKAGNLVMEHDLFAENAHDDIISYIRFEFSPEGSLSTLQLEVPDAKVEHLAERADGLFIWIATVLKHARVQPFDRLKAIDEILSSESASNAEAELDALYLRVLNSATAVSSDEKNVVRLTVGLIFVTSRNRQLPIEALHAFLSRLEELPVRISLSELENRVRKLGSVLLKDAQTSAIRVLHPSFLDFIGNKNRSKDFWTEASHLEELMAKLCLEIMKDGLKFNICHLGSSYQPNSEVKDPDLEERVSTYMAQELQYSSLHWLDHLSRYDHILSSVPMRRRFYHALVQLTPSPSTRSMGQVALPTSNPSVAKAVRQMLRDFFCTSQSLYWLECISLMGKLSAASPTLLQLLTHFKVFLKDTEVRDAASDLCRFVTLFQTPMSFSTPHIYQSALLWAPSESIISKKHCCKFIRSEAILKGRDIYYSPHLQILKLDAIVWCVAFSPDGRRFISGSIDGVVRIWDTQTGTPFGKPLEGHKSTVTSVRYSPDGSRVVSGSSDKTIRIWDAQTGVPVGKPLEGHKEWVMSVGYSPDGSRIVSGSDDTTIRIWDAQTGAPVGKPLEGHKSTVTSVGYSPDGNRIVSGSHDKTIRIWDAQTGAPVGKPLEGHKDSVRSVRYSPDGSRIISGSYDKTIRIWDAQTGAPIGKPLEGHKGWVRSVGYSPDGSRIVSGSHDRTIRIWDAQTGVPVGKPLEGHKDVVLSVGYSPDGSRIVSGSDDRTIRIWDAQTGAPVGKPLDGHKDWIRSVGYSPDGNRIVSGSDDTTIRIWDAQTSAPVGKPLEGHKGLVTSVRYSPDGNRIVSGSDDATIRIWDAQTGAPIGKPLEGHKDSVMSVGYSPDGGRIISGSDDRTIRIWDAQTGAPVGKPLDGHKSSVTSVGYSPNGSRIVAGSDDKTIRIWDAQTGVPIGKPLEGHKDSVTSVAYSPDGSRIISGSRDKTIQIWDAQTGAPIGKPLEGHKDRVWSVGYSSDRSRIVSGSDDTTIRIWDAQTGAPVGKPLEGHKDSVWSVGYSPDGSRIVSGSGDTTIRIWDARTGVSRGVGESRWDPNRKHFVSIHETNATAGAPDIQPITFSTIPLSIPLDGWIRTLDGGLLLWVPHEYRHGMCDMSLFCMPRDAVGHPIKIDWQSLCLGSNWFKVWEEGEGAVI